MPYLCAVWCPVCKKDWAVSDEIFLHPETRLSNLQCSKCGRFGFQCSTRNRTYAECVEALKIGVPAHTELDFYFGNGAYRLNRLKEIRLGIGEPQAAWEDEEYLITQIIDFFKCGANTIAKELEDIKRLQMKERPDLKLDIEGLQSLADYGHSCDDEKNGGGDGECLACGARDCPHGEPLHYHHDGCPSCWEPPEW